MPTFIDDTNPLIVGGGPSGLLAAIMLHQRNIPCTLLERQSAGYDLDISRTYHFALNVRGQRCVNVVPTLLSSLVAMSPSKKPYEYVYVNQDRTVNVRSVASMNPGHVPSLLYLRPRLIDGLRQFVKDTCSSVTTVYDTDVLDIGVQRATADGEKTGPVIHCTADVNGEHRTFTTRLLIACDGVHSVAVQSFRSLLAAAAESTEETNDAPPVATSRGLGTRTLISHATGMRIRSLVISVNIFDGLDGVPPDFADYWFLVKGKSFTLFVLPMLQDDIDTFGGVIATVGIQPDHPLWAAKDEDEAFDIFQDNLPQLKIRDVVSVEAMRTFVTGKTIVNPKITVLDSLVACIGDTDTLAESQCGVAFLGDAAHAVPPDFGQGVNSALEDVSVFMSHVDAASAEAADVSLHDVLRRYEAARWDDVNGLAEIGLFASKVLSDRTFVGKIDLWARVTLHKWMPALFAPTISAMFSLVWPYAVIRRRYRQTSVRLIVLAVVIVMVAVAVVVGVVRGILLLVM